MRRWLGITLLLAGCGASKQTRQSGMPELFRELETGLHFTHQSGASGKFYMTEIMGAGVAVLDYDNDGDLDVFCVQSIGESKLFRNEFVPSGTLRFTDVTSQSEISFRGYGMGVAAGDYNNDGFTDLLVTGYNARALYRNRGDGTFAPVAFPQPPGVWSTSGAFFDYDRDGRLDLVILSYVNFSEAANKSCQAPTGEPDYCTPRVYSPVSARLYHNDGGGKFTDVTGRSGINRALGPGLGVAAADLNDDGWPDLFVANDTAQNHIWINQRNGTFKEAGIESGAAYSEDGLAKAGMGVAVDDADGDGKEDLFVVNLMREGATLFRKDSITPQGLPVFIDITRQS
ncbi:MAG: FG-GAP repeat domain-containing protein, partial [Bryobacteraceae bacterium]